VGAATTVVVITVGDITAGGTLVVVTVEKGTRHSGWSLVRWVSCSGWTDPKTHVTPGIHGPQSGFSEPGAGGMNPPLAVATLDRGSPNLTGADGARKFGVC